MPADIARDDIRDQLYRFGLPYDTAMDHRERFAEQSASDVEFGEEKVFPEMIDALLEEIPEEISVLEVGAGTGALTRELLEKAGSVTALEPSRALIERLAASEWASHSPTLRAVLGLAAAGRKVAQEGGPGFFRFTHEERVA